MKKRINNYIRLAAIALLALTTYSCEKEVEVDLRSAPSRILIEGMIAEDSLATVRVSHTLDFSDNSGYPNLKGAIVRMWDDAGNSETLAQDASGWYLPKR